MDGNFYDLLDVSYGDDSYDAFDLHKSAWSARPTQMSTSWTSSPQTPPNDEEFLSTPGNSAQLPGLHLQPGDELWYYGAFSSTEPTGRVYSPTADALQLSYTSNSWEELVLGVQAPFLADVTPNSIDKLYAFSGIPADLDNLNGNPHTFESCAPQMSARSLPLVTPQLQPIDIRAASSSSTVLPDTNGLGIDPRELEAPIGLCSLGLPVRGLPVSPQVQSVELAAVVTPQVHALELVTASPSTSLSYQSFQEIPHAHYDDAATPRYATPRAGPLYLPSPPLTPPRYAPKAAPKRKAVTSKAAKAATRQKTRKTRSSTSRQSSSPSSYPGSPLRIVTKETRSTRNRTLRSPQGDLSSSLPGSKPQRWACPYHDCVMEFSRKKDCERHQNGHKGKQFFCAGLPVVGEAGELLEESEEWTRWEGLDGMLFVGGCGKAFSRKDAYTRHLRESCLGDPAGHWWEDPRIKRFLASLSS